MQPKINKIKNKQINKCQCLHYAGNFILCNYLHLWWKMLNVYREYVFLKNSFGDKSIKVWRQLAQTTSSIQCVPLIMVLWLFISPTWCSYILKAWTIYKWKINLKLEIIIWVLICEWEKLLETLTVSENLGLLHMNKQMNQELYFFKMEIGRASCRERV